MFRKYVLPWLVYYFYRIWIATWRQTVVLAPAILQAEQEKRPVIFAFWHGDELVTIQFVTRFRIATMVSTSKDGDLINFVVQKLGGDSSRGSSTRGGVAALKGLVRLVRSGKHNASVAVDGPKGPIHQVKPGIFELSKLTSAQIVPMGVAVSSAKVFEKSWNKAFLPWPFARVVTVFTEPFPAVPREGSFSAEEWCEKLRTALFDARQQALKKLDEISTRC